MLNFTDRVIYDIAKETLQSVCGEEATIHTVCKMNRGLGDFPPTFLDQDSAEAYIRSLPVGGPGYVVVPRVLKPAQPRHGGNGCGEQHSPTSGECSLSSF
jgi:hypothetical protein